jgi:hypothetical protein
MLPSYVTLGIKEARSEGAELVAMGEHWLLGDFDTM